MRWQRRGRRLVKNVFLFNFNLEISHLFSYIFSICQYSNLPQLNMLRIRSILNTNPLRFTVSRQRRIWSFHVFDLQRTAKKCTKIYNVRAQPLFCSLNHLFSEVLAVVGVAFCVRSLIMTTTASPQTMSLYITKEFRSYPIIIDAFSVCIGLRISYS